MSEEHQELQLLDLLDKDYYHAKYLFQKHYLLTNYKRNNNNTTKTAAQIGIDRSTLHKWIKKYDNNS